MQRGTTIADPELPFRLTDEQMLDRAKTLAEKIALRTRLVEDKRAEMKRRNDEIEAVDQVIASIGTTILDGFENRKQGTLTFSETEAAKNLAAIAAAAEKLPWRGHEFVAADGAEGCFAVVGEGINEHCLLKRDEHGPKPAPAWLGHEYCEVEGFEGCGAVVGEDKDHRCGLKADEHGAEDQVPAAPLPSEPHAFTPAEPGGVACFVCGSSESDSVHGATEAFTPALETHEFVESENDDAADECATCGGGANEIVHQVGDEEPTVLACENFEPAHNDPETCLNCGNREVVHEATPDEEGVGGEAVEAKPGNGRAHASARRKKPAPKGVLGRKAARGRRAHA